MITLTTTRFNTNTWNERERWMVRHNWEKGCIYGTPVCVKEHIYGTMIVLEMHNDENRIKAIGLLKNRHNLSDKNFQLYEDRNYNRYIYKGDYRIEIQYNEKTNAIENASLTDLEKKIINIFNRLLFKGACHLKRAQGITAVPHWIMSNKRVNFLKHFKEIFARHFTPSEL
jgi:hypothetical protein